MVALLPYGVGVAAITKKSLHHQRLTLTVDRDRYHVSVSICATIDARRIAEGVIGVHEIAHRATLDRSTCHDMRK